MVAWLAPEEKKSQNHTFLSVFGLVYEVCKNYEKKLLLMTYACQMYLPKE